MKKTIAAIILISMGVTGYILLSKTRPDKETETIIPKKRYVTAEGKVEAMPGAEVEVGSELDGKIAEFFIEEGDWIKKGDTIARLENSDIHAKLREAEAGLSVV
ncbi:MAG: biotin/lipoyl-binding protein [Nitrospirae bacterium]|nr:biotin/lipoyl-binding protein [Nitrospirota bacterium]